MLLLRLLLPDRPGQLGAVATAMGTVGASIQAVEIVERSSDGVVNDFWLELPPGALPDPLVSACTGVDGVDVLWLSRYPDSWGLESDIEILDRMLEDPRTAAVTLTEAAPVVFHCHWALLVRRATGRTTCATSLAPDLTPGQLATMGALDEVHAVDLADGWLESWGAVTCAIAPAQHEQAIILGRQGGPAWLGSELARLRLLAAMVP